LYRNAEAAECSLKNISAIAPAISTGNRARDLTGNSTGGERIPRMLMFMAGRASLRSLRKNRGFVSGHRFSCDSQDLTLHTTLSDGVAAVTP